MVPSMTLNGREDPQRIPLYCETRLVVIDKEGDSLHEDE